MFFYLYAIIELIAFFLDSNIIPTANSSYPVSAETVPFRTTLNKCSGVCYSGLWHHTPASLRPPIAAFSSMVSWAFSLPRMAHHYHYGCDRPLSSLR